MRKEKKFRKETTMKENVGKLLLDLGKLAVGGVVTDTQRWDLSPFVILYGY